MVAFFVKYDDSVPAYMDSVYNYIHFASIWYDFRDYEDNSIFIPTRAISDSREIYQLPEAAPQGGALLLEELDVVLWKCVISK